MSKVAFFVDGNFMRKKIFSYKSFIFTGRNIREYCLRHLTEDECIYRIFYYDAPPLDRTITYPSGIQKNLGETPAAQKQNELLDSIRETPNMALRLGKVRLQKDDFILKSATLSALVAAKITVIKDDDVHPNIQQKAVDMKIGLDIATITFKRLADRIVLIAGDSDFSPAAKLARMEGMHVTLDPLGNKVPEDLLEHIDVMCTKLNPDNTHDVAATKKTFFVACKKSLP